MAALETASPAPRGLGRRATHKRTGSSFLDQVMDDIFDTPAQNREADGEGGE